MPAMICCDGRARVPLCACGCIHCCSPSSTGLFWHRPMEKKLTLDRIDLKILAVLQQDGRISFQKLSEHVNLTPRPCLERVRRLEKAGIIKGYTAIVDMPQPQHAIVILAEVALADHVVSQQAFTRELQNTPEVLDCWLVSGNFDFLVRIGCRDMNEYRELAERWLGSSSFKISRILTTTELQAIKRQQALPPVPGAAGSDGC